MLLCSANLPSASSKNLSCVSFPFFFEKLYINFAGNVIVIKINQIQPSMKCDRKTCVSLPLVLSPYKIPLGPKSSLLFSRKYEIRSRIISAKFRLRLRPPGKCITDRRKKLKGSDKNRFAQQKQSGFALKRSRKRNRTQRKKISFFILYPRFEIGFSGPIRPISFLYIAQYRKLHCPDQPTGAIDLWNTIFLR